MEYWKREHNRPISIVIKGYMDKKRGKVTDSRKEIQRRFDGLDWEYQKQILFAFLQSGATDRDWAYRKLYPIWDDCFIPMLQELWEKYHEKPLSWIIIRFFPTDYLKEHLEELSEGRNYFFIYERLAEDKEFVLDRTKLNEVDLLYVRRSLGETITNDDVEDLFYLLIYKICKGPKGVRYGKIAEYNNNGGPIISLFNNYMIKDMIYTSIYFYSIEDNLRKWMYMVSEDFLKEHKAAEKKSPKYESIFDRIAHRESDFDRMVQRMKEVCYKHIPNKYTAIWDTFDISDQQSFLDDLDERHKKHLLNKKQS